MHDVRIRLLVAIDKRRQQLTRLESFGPEDDFEVTLPPNSLLVHNPSSHFTNGHSERNGIHSDQHNTTETITQDLKSELAHALQNEAVTYANGDLTIKTDNEMVENNPDKILGDKVSQNVKNSDKDISYRTSDPTIPELPVKEKTRADFVEELQIVSNKQFADDEFEIINDPPTTNKPPETKQRKCNTINSTDVTPKLQNLRQKFSSPVITENTVKQSVKSVKSIKTSEVTEMNETSKRVNRTDVKPVEKIKKKNSIVDKVDENITDTSTSKNETIDNAVVTQDKTADTTQNNLVNGEIEKPPTEILTKKQNDDSPKINSTDNKKLKKQISLKRKSITETESSGHVNDKQLEEPETKQVKKLKGCLPEKKPSPTKVKRKSRDYSIDKVRRYNERVKKYNNNVEKENNRSPGAFISSNDSPEQTSNCLLYTSPSPRDS